MVFSTLIQNFQLQRPQKFLQVWCFLHRLKNFYLQRTQTFFQVWCFYIDSKISTFSGPRNSPSSATPSN
eukprot:UN24963